MGKYLKPFETEDISHCPYCGREVDIIVWQGGDFSFFCKDSREKCGHEFNVQKCTRAEAIAMHNKRLESDRLKKLESLTDILENLMYWDTCPDTYKDRVAEALGLEDELKEHRRKEHNP